MDHSAANSVEAQSKGRFSLKRAALSLFLAVGYGSLLAFFFIPFGELFASMLGLVGPFGVPALWLLGLLVAVPLIYRRVTLNGPQRAVIAAEVLVLMALPLMGTLYNVTIGQSCVETDCDAIKVHRALALPNLAHLWVLHALSVLAYVISRRRAEPLPARGELLVLGGMAAGCVVQTLLGIQFGEWLVYGIVGAPVLMCAASPVLALALFLRELVIRVSRNARRSLAVPGMVGTATGLLGAYGFVEAILGGHKGAAFDVLTRTCSYTFSQLPISHMPCTGHYLCTVAACGHPRLVKPIRLGMRAGEPIIVNRQLAIANAFEGLLQERFPRLGFGARRAYDRFGLPVAKLIRHPLLADATYLLMKPAEWCFYVFLLLFDTQDPEIRLGRMYPWK